MDFANHSAVSQDWPSSISLCLHIMARQCRTWAACINRSVSLLSWHWPRIARISHGLCTHLSRIQAWTANISLHRPHQPFSLYFIHILPIYDIYQIKIKIKKLLKLLNLKLLYLFMSYEFSMLIYILFIFFLFLFIHYSFSAFIKKNKKIKKIVEVIEYKVTIFSF